MAIVKIAICTIAEMKSVIKKAFGLNDIRSSKIFSGKII